MKALVSFGAAMIVLLQLSMIGVVGFFGYYVYANGLKALIDAVWLGFI